MSDLCMNEIVDFAWDEFCQSDDHIVPHPGSKRLDDHSSQPDSHKKPRREITSNSSDSMLEKDSWSNTANGAFSSASDSNTKEASSLASDNTVPSTHGQKSNNTDSNSNEFSGNDTLLDDKTTIVDNNSFTYPLGDINHTVGDVNFFENAENKDSSDFLYYGWPEIGNFEDVDTIFRNCDSTFGLGVCKEDDMGWLSAADDLGRTEDKFSCPEPNVVENISENNDSSKGYSINGSALASAPIRCKDSSWTSDKSDSYMSFVIGPSDSKDEFTPQDQGLGAKGNIQPRISPHSHSRTGSAATINEQKKQIRVQKQSEGKSKQHYFESGAFNPPIQGHSGVTSHQAIPSVHMQQQQHSPYPDSFHYLQNPISYAQSDISQLSEPDSVNLEPSIVKPESKDTTHQGNKSYLSSSLKNGSVVQASMFDAGSAGKYETHNDPGGVGLATPAGLDSSNVQESSTLSSGIHDISLEAASFRQLQLVMGQLDSRTKLCIRDSLYRLARSAKQRHNHANINVGCGDERDATGGASVAEDTNECTSFIDMETDTNPIDRSIAHLLFHRPSDSSTKPAHDSFPFKSTSMVQGSVANQPALVENLVGEKTVSEVDKPSVC